MPRKTDHYMAIKDDRRDLPSRIFDMLRYDACYPVSNAPTGWVLLKQPYRDGIKGGFTLARWESFGFRAGVDYLIAEVTVNSGTPYDLVDACRVRNNAAKQD